MADEDTAIVEEERIEEDEEPSAESPQEEGQELAELRANLEERERRIAALEEEVGTLHEELAMALQKYRSSLLASAPEIPEELVQGGTTHELEEAFARARAMVERIRNELEAKASRERVPPGAPARSAPDLSTLSAREKIAYGLARVQPWTRA
jgi:uncharacterized coiled-coil DUF342 family protein